MICIYRVHYSVRGVLLKAVENAVRLDWK